MCTLGVFDVQGILTCVSSGDEICALTPPVGTNGSIPSTLASLILIDRQLDVVTPALHQVHVLDQIFGSLPARGSSNHGRSQSSDGRTSEVTKRAPGQQDQSLVPEVVSIQKPMREAGSEAGAEACTEAGAEAGSAAEPEVEKEAEDRADRGGSKTEGGSEAANEGWSGTEEDSVPGSADTLQPEVAEITHQAPQQKKQQRQQQQHQPAQRSMFSLR